MERETKLTEAIRLLSRTGINLVGQKLGESNNGSPFYDKLAPKADIETFPIGDQVSFVPKWGRLSAYADRRTFLVVQDHGGNCYVVIASHQDSANQSLVAKVLSLLKKDGGFRLAKTSGIAWHCVSGDAQ